VSEKEFLCEQAQKISNPVTGSGKSELTGMFIVNTVGNRNILLSGGKK
jgi:hypothetical protein